MTAMTTYTKITAAVALEAMIDRPNEYDRADAQAVLTTAKSEGVAVMYLNLLRAAFPGISCGTGSDDAGCSPAYLCPDCIKALAAS